MKKSGFIGSVLLLLGVVHLVGCLKYYSGPLSNEDVVGTWVLSSIPEGIKFEDNKNIEATFCADGFVVTRNFPFEDFGKVCDASMTSAVGKWKLIPPDKNSNREKRWEMEIVFDVSKDKRILNFIVEDGYLRLNSVCDIDNPYGFFFRKVGMLTPIEGREIKK